MAYTPTTPEDLTSPEQAAPPPDGGPMSGPFPVPIRGVIPHKVPFTAEEEQ